MEFVVPIHYRTVMFWTITFMLSCGVILYVLVGYPALIRAMEAGKRSSSTSQDSIAARDLPLVSVIVPCLNESARVRPKVENVFSTSYPASRMEVFFVATTRPTTPSRACRNSPKSFP